MKDTFDMDWLQKVLEIRPVFKSSSIYWSNDVNTVLANNAEEGNNELSLLVLECLERYFLGDWGDVEDEVAYLNNQSLNRYLNSNPSPGFIKSMYTSESYTIVATTNADYSITKI